MNEFNESGYFVKEDFIVDGDRDLFDYDFCAGSKGWAQFDTPSDARYYGKWLNPFELRAVSYAEGDVWWYTFRDRESFISWVRRTSNWYFSHEGEYAMIDALCQDSIAQAFKDLGLGDLLH